MQETPTNYHSLGRTPIQVTTHLLHTMMKEHIFFVNESYDEYINYKGIASPLERSNFFSRNHSNSHAVTIPVIVLIQDI